MLLVSIPVGCGIKGPPLPARTPSLPQVTDLTYRLEGAIVTPAWRISNRLDGRRSGRASFGIYRFRRNLDAPACDACPQVFEKVAAEPYVDSDDHRFTTAMVLDPGYRYGFKVRLESDQRNGANAAPVWFDFPVDASSPTTETP